MGPSLRVRLTVLCLAALPWACSTAPVFAQGFGDPRLAFDLTPDPLARSPRLLGMGSLSLVVDDPHNRINLWDFAGNPTGLDVDSVSTLELRPGTRRSSGIRDVPASGLLRQQEAGSGLHFGYETWRREGSTVYGVIGDLESGRTDRTYSDFAELRSHSSQPSIMPVITGVMPRTTSGRLRYALRVISSTHSLKDDFRLIRDNGTGEYIDQNGEQLSTPNPFTPDETRVSRLGVGFATSYRLGPSLTAAAGIDGLRDKLSGDNTSPLYDSQIRERRPYGVGQVSLVGRLGRSLEWGVDGRGWRSSSQENWLFTVSLGTGAQPLIGRGKLLERKEEGSTLRTRARWSAGAFEVGAGFNTGYRKVTITPPAADDRSSLNHFLNVSYGLIQTGAFFPDSVVADLSKERVWGAGGGLAWRLPAKRGIVGIEYHRSRRIQQRDVGGEGPRRIDWDVRSGLEYRCTNALAGRVGYQYSWEDRNKFTRQNEYVGHTLSLGAGVHPAGASWTVESGYAFRWDQADFGDPGKPRESHQQFAAQARWSF